MSSRKNSACRRLCSAARVQIASSTSRGIIPDAARTAIPAAIRRLRPATRTMKNSSRLLAKNAIDRTRSSRGRLTSSAISSRRRLKRSQESSRSRKRSSYFARCASASASGTYGGSTSKVSCTAPSSGTGSSAGLGTALDTVMNASVAPRGERWVASPTSVECDRAAAATAAPSRPGRARRAGAWCPAGAVADRPPGRRGGGTRRTPRRGRRARARRRAPTAAGTGPGCCRRGAPRRGRGPATTSDSAARWPGGRRSAARTGPRPGRTTRRPPPGSAARPRGCACR